MLTSRIDHLVRFKRNVNFFYRYFQSSKDRKTAIFGFHNEDPSVYKNIEKKKNNKFFKEANCKKGCLYKIFETAKKYAKYTKYMYIYIFWFL